MSTGPLEGMDTQRPIAFLEALLHLQAMLGREVKVELNDYGCFFGCGFAGRLERIETMPEGKEAISALISGGAGVFLDPEECQPFLVQAGDEIWLEFHRPVGPTVAIHAVGDAIAPSDAAER